ncbi:hypothetical protein CHH92_18805 [Bacillus sonorensis]|nr:hypothetical protein CHH92_18805 [Bacillus sonorensis]
MFKSFTIKTQGAHSGLSQNHLRIRICSWTERVFGNYVRDSIGKLVNILIHLQINEGQFEIF